MFASMLEIKAVAWVWWWSWRAVGEARDVWEVKLTTLGYGGGDDRGSRL